jgi:hypothetical protein
MRSPGIRLWAGPLEGSSPSRGYISCLEDSISWRVARSALSDPPSQVEEVRAIAMKRLARRMERIGDATQRSPAQFAIQSEALVCALAGRKPRATALSATSTPQPYRELHPIRKLLSTLHVLDASISSARHAIPHRTDRPNRHLTARLWDSILVAHPDERGFSDWHDNESRSMVSCRLRSFASHRYARIYFTQDTVLLYSQRPMYH